MRQPFVTRSTGVLIVAGLVVTLLAPVAQAQESRTTEALSARLKMLEDKEAIGDVLVAYGRALDSRDFKAYGSLFAKDGTWSGGMGSAQTPEGIQKMVEGGFAKMSPELYTDSNHVMTSMDIEVSGDTAKAWSRWLWVIKAADGKPRLERGGRYEDTLVREDGKWKFKTRATTTEINK